MMKNHKRELKKGPAMTRRGFIGGSTALGGLLLASNSVLQETLNARPAEWPQGKPLIVQPVLTYDTPQRQDRTSWRSYGGIHTDDAATAEALRIQEELQQLVA
ncbi:MAG TPA: twin-arginine translocation signal domain-containing protein, partial [Candidatus Hydrogenedentes bacterium]|nr:twin-arginine translocation signal domain-containing protein [Candidatus Hydrogenedentota bacterium]